MSPDHVSEPLPVDDAGVLHALTHLKSLSPTDLLTKQKVAELFGVKSRTVQRMVSRYELPPAAYGQSGAKRWMVGHIIEWVTGRIAKTYDEAKQRAEYFAGI